MPSAPDLVNDHYATVAGRIVTTSTSLDSHQYLDPQLFNNDLPNRTPSHGKNSDTGLTILVANTVHRSQGMNNTSAGLSEQDTLLLQIYHSRVHLQGAQACQTGGATALAQQYRTLLEIYHSRAYLQLAVSQGHLTGISDQSPHVEEVLDHSIFLEAQKTFYKYFQDEVDIGYAQAQRIFDKFVNTGVARDFAVAQSYLHSCNIFTLEKHVE